MEINITIFIQVINFLITYFFLDRVFFKPVIASLKKRKNFEKSLLNKVLVEEQTLLNSHEFKKKQLFDFQQKVRAETPHLWKAPNVQNPEINYEKDKKEVADAASVARDLILEKVLNCD